MASPLMRLVRMVEGAAGHAGRMDEAKLRSAQSRVLRAIGRSTLRP
jgi:hypothetical protein